METAKRVQCVRVMAKGAETLDDAEVELYLNLAEQAVLNKLYPFSDPTEKTLPGRYEYVMLRVAAYNINKRGAEGETKHIEVGTERDFASGDIPDDLLREITPMCGVPQ